MTTTCAAPERQYRARCKRADVEVSSPQFKVLEKVIEAKHLKSPMCSRKRKSFMMKADNFGFHGRYWELNSLTNCQTIADVADENSDELQHLARANRGPLGGGLSESRSSAGRQSILKMLPGGTTGETMGHAQGSQRSHCRLEMFARARTPEPGNEYERPTGACTAPNGQGFTYYDPFPDDYDEQEHSGMHGAIVHDLFKDYEKNGGSLPQRNRRRNVQIWGHALRGTLGRNSASPASRRTCHRLRRTLACARSSRGGQAEAGDTIPTGRILNARYEALSVTAPRERQRN